MKRTLIIFFVFAFLSSANSDDIMKIEDIKIGMKGYGLSVFKGTEVEKFDVEVKGILKNVLPKQDFIVIKCDSKILEKSMIIAGMSGSPIYINGKIIGALSRGFAYQKDEPIALVTPIEDMLKVKDRPMEGSYLKQKGESNNGIDILPVSTPMYLSGFSGTAYDLMKEWVSKSGFVPVMGGSGDMLNTENVELKPGSAVGMQFIRGDWNAAGVGTVTYVDKDNVLAFGHAGLDVGEIECPMTAAYVYGINSSYYLSSKISSVGKEIGSIVQDRSSAISGKIGKKSFMLPVNISVDNEKTGLKQKYSYEVIKQERLTSTFLLYTIFNSLELAEGIDNSGSTVKYKIIIKAENFPEVVLEDIFSDKNDLIRLSSSDMRIPGRLLMLYNIFLLINNSYENLNLKSFDIELKVIHKRKAADIESIWLNSYELKAGSKISVNALIKPFNSKTEKITMEIEIPANIPEGDYEITILGGMEATKQMSSPENIEELLEYLKNKYKADCLVGKLELPSIGIVTKGKNMPNLPGSIFSGLISRGSAELKVERDMVKNVIGTEWVIEGKKKVNVKITNERSK